MSRLEPLAQAVLDARAAHSGATLADLYDPDLMPTNLRRAHQELLTVRSTGSIAARASLPSASASSIYSCSMRRCAHRWKPG